jgi:uncharacterized protein YjbI with pentapeptide repeats
LLVVPDDLKVPSSLVPLVMAPTATDLAQLMYSKAEWLDLRSELTVKVRTEAKETGAFELGSGPAADLPDLAVVLEMFRCYFFALEWLRASNIVQLDATQTSLVATLTHDRYSGGLAAWRSRQAPTFDEAVWRYTASRGQVMRWASLNGSAIDGFREERLASSVRSLGWGSQTSHPDAGPDSQRLVTNVRWRSCSVRDTEFTDVVFVNCDFAGSTFYNCTFDGATFVNCVLDHVDFVGCTVVGEAVWPDKQILDSLPKDVIERPPSFDFEIAPTVAEALSALADINGPSGQPPFYLHSTTAGEPAKIAPAGAPISHLDRGPQLPLKPGGLVMCGGRLSSLTFRKCELVDSMEAAATIALRHVAGTSLEVCEQRSGRFDIFAAAIRGFTVTRPVADLETGADVAAGQAGRFDFRLHHAKVINTWFGVGLHGAASFDNCKVWQLINASDDTFSVKVARSEFFGLVNTGLPADIDDPTGSGPNRQFDIDSLGKAGHDLRELSEKIDFRESDGNG